MIFVPTRVEHFYAGTCSWSVLAFWVDTPSGAVVAMMCASLATAFSDVVVDSIVVEKARGAPQVAAITLSVMRLICAVSVHYIYNCFSICHFRIHFDSCYQPAKKNLNECL
jgi:hypothetical protein